MINLNNKLIILILNILLMTSFATIQLNPLAVYSLDTITYTGSDIDVLSNIIS